MPEENKKIEKNTVNIIITPAEKVENGNHFYHEVILQIVPERLKRIKQSGITFGIIRMENIRKILFRTGP